MPIAVAHGDAKLGASGRGEEVPPGRPIAIVDSASAMAEAAAQALGGDVTDRRAHAGALACFATDISRLDELAPRFLGEAVTSFELVDL